MPEFLSEVNLQNYNTLAVPARARYFVSLTDSDQLPEALAFAREHDLPLLVLGGGSNIVLREDFPGLVLHLNWRGRELIHSDDEFYWLKVAAGENWHQLVLYCLEQGYWGMENLALIPGSVGAAPIQNIGAYGVELKDLFAELEAWEIQSGKSVVFDTRACEFGYRDSVFKNSLRDRYIITSVTFKLRRQSKVVLSYPALKAALPDRPVEDIGPRELAEAVCRLRQEKLPDPAQTPNAGSFFKNPIVETRQFQRLQQDYPELVSYPVDDRRVKLAAAWLIDQAGWKGVTQGPVAVHSEQALVLTNPGRAMGSEVLALAERIQQSVKEKFGVQLEPEPRIYP